MITDRHDHRSNRCQKCNHTYTSAYHARHCGIKSKSGTVRHSRRAWGSGGGSSNRRTMGEILSSSHSWADAQVEPTVATQQENSNGR